MFRKIFSRSSISKYLWWHRVCYLLFLSDRVQLRMSGKKLPCESEHKQHDNIIINTRVYKNLRKSRTVHATGFPVPTNIFCNQNELRNTWNTILFSGYFNGYFLWLKVIPQFDLFILLSTSLQQSRHLSRLQQWSSATLV